MENNAKKKAVAGNNGSNIFDYFSDNQKAFSTFNYAEKQENMQLNLFFLMKSDSEFVWLYRYFDCNEDCFAQKSSACFFICQTCYMWLHGEGKSAGGCSNG